jgi:phage gp46-like protein
MGDIATIWDAGNAQGDWQVGVPDLVTGGDLVTAILISLFTDATASPDDAIPDGTTDPRGWWGDLGKDRPIGSKIWLRMRAKATNQTLNTVRGDIIEALKWLIDDGVASQVDVICEWTQPGMLGAQITVHQPAGPPTVLNFGWVWGQLNAAQPPPVGGPFILGVSTLGGGDVL